jgi:hypothetical protein
MTAQPGDTCESRIEEVRRWFESLPEGVAEMEIDSSHQHYEVVVTIRPLLHPDAAGFEIGFVAGDYDVWLTDGRGESRGGYMDNRCRDASPVGYCEAIASGGLTVTEYRREGRRVILRHELRLDGEILDYNWFGESGGCGCAGLPWMWLWRRRRKWEEAHTEHYPPYY